MLHGGMLYFIRIKIYFGPIGTFANRSVAVLL